MTSFFFKPCPAGVFVGPELVRCRGFRVGSPADTPLHRKRSLGRKGVTQQAFSSRG
jgi:hypothetical protein